MKIVHVGAVRPGAYDPRDIRASVVSRWATSILYKQLTFVNDFVIGIPSLLYKYFISLIKKQKF